MPRWLTMSMLIAPPAALFVVLTLGLLLAVGFRRSAGAYNTLPAGAWIVIGAVVLAHAGYLAAPLLYLDGRVRLALWTTLPVAVLATGGLLVSQALWPSKGAMPVSSRMGEQMFAAIIAASVFVHWVPVVALLVARGPLTASAS